MKTRRARRARTQSADVMQRFDGFSLQAAVRLGARDRRRAKQGCRYITRQALSEEWAQINAVGQMELKRATPWRNCTPRLVMSPVEFTQRQLVRAGSFSETP